MKRITQKEVATLPSGIYPLADCLVLKVNEKSKVRSFVVRTTVDGRRRDISVGSAKRITISQAKELAKKILQDVALGTFEKKKAEVIFALEAGVGIIGFIKNAVTGA